MSKENLRLAAAACAGVFLMTLYQGGDELMQFSGRPTGEQWAGIASAIGAALAWWKGRDGGGGGAPTLDLLQAIKRIIEQFKAQGIPSELSLILKWGDDVYDLNWIKRTKPEPKP